MVIYHTMWENPEAVRRIRMQQCPKCGQTLPMITDAFCPNCRQPFEPELPDAPTSQQNRKSTFSVPLLPTFGVVIAVSGFFVRCGARWLAWPPKWSYSGERANTEWAYNEALYSDLGNITMAFGLALICIAVAKWKHKPVPNAK